jgi:hypothetical protein
MKELFDTKDKAELGIANFKNLKANAGWQTLVEIVEANIKILEQQILEGVEGMTEEDMNRKRDKLRAYKEVIETPDFWISKLSASEPFEEATDPYYTVETLREDRKRR